MSLEFVFKPNDVTTENLHRLSFLQSRLEEERICELSELANAAFSAACKLSIEEMSAYEILSLLSDALVFDKGSVHSDALPVNFEALKKYLSTLSELDKAEFTSLFCDKMSSLSLFLSENDFLPENTGRERLVYVKNPLADEAFDVFSQNFTDPRVIYASTFKDALLSVAEGEADYCLLPLEERGGNRLHTVAELLFKGDFKINSVTPVFGFDGNADVKYALVSKYFSVPSISIDDDRYLEIMISKDFSEALSSLLLASKRYGINPHRINTSSFETEEGTKYYYSLLFKSEGGDFTLLLAYLTLFLSEFIPIGIYKNLE